MERWCLLARDLTGESTEGHWRRGAGKSALGRLVAKQPVRTHG